MYGSEVYGGSAYANIDEIRRVISPGPSAGTTPSGQRVSPRGPTISRTARSTPTRTQARVEPMVGQAILSPQVFANQWLHGLYSGKHFIFTVTENYVHTVWPTPAEADELSYIKRHVKIEGTPDSPETFTTNIGKLATMQTGVAFPTFTDATHVYGVEFQHYQGGVPYLVTEPSVTSGNITFTVAVDYGGNPSSDTFFYADIKIQLQVKP